MFEMYAGDDDAFAFRIVLRVWHKTRDENHVCLFTYAVLAWCGQFVNRKCRGLRKKNNNNKTIREQHSNAFQMGT